MTKHYIFCVSYEWVGLETREQRPKSQEIYETRDPRPRSLKGKSETLMIGETGNPKQTSCRTWDTRAMIQINLIKYPINKI